MGDVRSIRTCDSNKDVVQRRLRHLKVHDASSLHQFGQQNLRVGVSHHAQFLQSAEVRHFLHSMDGPRVETIAFHTHTDGVASVTVLDGFQSPVEHLVAFVDHENEIAHFLSHTHIVC